LGGNVDTFVSVPRIVSLHTLLIKNVHLCLNWHISGQLFSFVKNNILMKFHLPKIFGRLWF